VSGARALPLSRFLAPLSLAKARARASARARESEPRASERKREREHVCRASHTALTPYSMKMIYFQGLRILSSSSARCQE
jgi:hypothetical protein